MTQYEPAMAIALLLDKGYRQHEIAEMVGTTQATISRIFTGKITDPGFQTALAIDKLAKSLLREVSDEPNL